MTPYTLSGQLFSKGISKEATSIKSKLLRPKVKNSAFNPVILLTNYDLG